MPGADMRCYFQAGVNIKPGAVGFLDSTPVAHAVCPSPVVADNRSLTDSELISIVDIYEAVLLSPYLFKFHAHL